LASEPDCSDWATAVGNTAETMSLGALWVPQMAALSVRRHINWNNQRPDLKEDLAHLV